jgi:hypothetical protein
VTVQAALEVKGSARADKREGITCGIARNDGPALRPLFRSRQPPRLPAAKNMQSGQKRRIDFCIMPLAAAGDMCNNVCMGHNSPTSTDEMIGQIGALIRDNPQWNRLRLSQELCGTLDWKGANGQAKYIIFVAVDHVFKLYSPSYVVIYNNWVEDVQELRNKIVDNVLGRNKWISKDKFLQYRIIRHTHFSNFYYCKAPLSSDLPARCGYVLDGEGNGLPQDKMIPEAATPPVAASPRQRPRRLWRSLTVRMGHTLQGSG